MVTKKQFNFYEQRAANDRLTCLLYILLPVAVLLYTATCWLVVPVVKTCLLLPKFADKVMLGDLRFISALFFRELRWAFSSYQLLVFILVAIVFLAGLFYTVMDGSQASEDYLLDQLNAYLISNYENEKVANDCLELVDELVVAFNLRYVDCYVTNSKLINVYTSGDYEEATLVITSGALETLNRNELSCLLASSLAHVGMGDTKELYTFLNAVSFFALASKFLAIAMFGTDEKSPVPYFTDVNDDEKKSAEHFSYIFWIFAFLVFIPICRYGDVVGGTLDSMLYAPWLVINTLGVLLLASLVAYLITKALKALILHVDDYDADAIAAEVNRDKDSLLSLLYKVNDQRLALTTKDLQNDPDKISYFLTFMDYRPGISIRPSLWNRCLRAKQLDGNWGG